MKKNILTLKSYLLIPSLLLSSLNNIHAQDYMKIRDTNQDKMFSYVYKQDSFQLVDVQGDVSLCKSIVDTGVTQIGTLLTFKLPSGGHKDRMYDKAIKIYPDYVIKEDLSNPYDEVAYEEAKKLDDHRKVKINACKVKSAIKISPFYVDKFSDMLKQVIMEESENFRPIRGEHHTWSPGFKLKYQHKCPLVTMAPKMLLMLATGVSSRFAVSGLEDDFAREVSRYPVRSLYPHDVFRIAYRIAQGNVYKAILTIENVFSRHWTAPKREAKQVVTRLAHITNDPNGDNFGTWYHLFGVMLFGYSHGSLMSWTAGFVEGVGSGINSGFKAETQENKVNRLGARIGGVLKRFMKSQKRRDKFKLNKTNLDPRHYLNLLELDCRAE